MAMSADVSRSKGVPGRPPGEKRARVAKSYTRTRISTSSRTPDDILRPKAIGAGRLPTPATLILLAQIARFAQVAIRTGWEMIGLHFAAKADVFL